jgi:hypothetical protein
MQNQPMGFTEAIGYGLTWYRHENKILKREHSELKAGLQGSRPDLIAPSSLAPPVHITPELTHAAETFYNLVARDRGLPYDEEIVAAAEDENEARERFLASGWSRLFPKLTHPPETINLS